MITRSNTAQNIFIIFFKSVAFGLIRVFMLASTYFGVG